MFGGGDREKVLEWASNVGGCLSQALRRGCGKKSAASL